MRRQKGVVPLASDLSDEEPADRLLRVVARILDDSIVAGSQKRHVREDLLVHGTLDQAVGSCAPLGDDGRALGVGALKPVYRPGPHLTRFDGLHPGNPAGQRAIGLELAPRLDGGVGQQVLQASPRRGWRIDCTTLPCRHAIDRGNAPSWGERQKRTGQASALSPE